MEEGLTETQLKPPITLHVSVNVFVVTLRL
jgi:hypothetical protein